MKKNPLLIVPGCIILGALALSVVVSLLFPSKRPQVQYSQFDDKSETGFWILKEYVKRCGIDLIERPDDKEIKNAIVFVQGKGISAKENEWDPQIQKFLENGNTVFLLTTSSVISADGTECRAEPDPQESAQSPIPDPQLSDSLASLLPSLDYGVFPFVPAGYSAILFIERGTDDEKRMLPLILRASAKNGTIYYCAPRVFENKFLADSEYAILIRNIFLKHGAQFAHFAAEEPAESKTQSAPLGAFLHKNVILTFFHAIFSVLLLILYYAVRFGNPVSLRKYGKRKITEHLEAVGGFWKQRKADDLCETIMVRYFKRMTETMSGKLPEAERRLRNALCNEKTGLSATQILELNLKRQEFLDKNLKRRIDHE